MLLDNKKFDIRYYCVIYQYIKLGNS